MGRLSNTFEEFWDTQAAPVLKKAGLPSHYDHCVDFLPEVLEYPFLRLWDGGRFSSYVALDMLYNGWARAASRLDRELDPQTACRWMSGVSPDVDRARREFVSGVMANIEKAVREVEAEKKRKRELRENTRLVRLGVDDIRALIALIGELSGVYGRIRETLVKSLERRK